MEFADIKVGDQVIVYEKVKTVHRVTKTRFSAGNYEFTKDGREYGVTSSWSGRAWAYKAEGQKLESALTKTNLSEAKESFELAFKKIANFSGYQSKSTLEQSEKLKALADEFLKNISEVIG